LPFFSTITFREAETSAVVCLLLAPDLALDDFVCFLAGFSVDVDVVAASAMGAASIEADASTATAMALMGVKPKNLEKMESDRNMIRSAHQDGASLGN
jgi:hypothetical protein